VIWGGTRSADISETPLGYGASRFMNFLVVEEGRGPASRSKGKN